MPVLCTAGRVIPCLCSVGLSRPAAQQREVPAQIRRALNPVAKRTLFGVEWRLTLLEQRRYASIRPVAAGRTEIRCLGLSATVRERHSCACGPDQTGKPLHGGNTPRRRRAIAWRE